MCLLATPQVPTITIKGEPLTENDNAIIVHALECVIAHAKRTQQIFVAQCVWWLALIIGLEQDLVSHIDRLQGQRNTKPAEQLPRDYLQESRWLREIAALKVSGKTTTGQIHPTKESKKYLRRSKRVPKSAAVETEGIEISEIKERKQRTSASGVPGLLFEKEIIGSEIAVGQLS